MRTLKLAVTALVIGALAGLMGLANPADAAVPRCNGKAATNPGSLAGTPGDDVIVGTPGDDVIDAGAGDDTICGLGGSDTIDGGADDDWLDGGDGVDYLEQTFATNGGNDVVKGGDGDDDLGSSNPAGDDAYDGGRGNDWIIDLEGKNVAHGGPGADYISLSGQAYGDAGDDFGVFADETSPGAGDAVASGGSGNDGYGNCFAAAVVVWGGTADGGSGDDRVCVKGDGSTGKGGSGSDRINGGDFIGTNKLIDCGAGFDTYSAGATDTVRRCEAVINNP